MRRYLKFAASFWMSAFLTAGTMAGIRLTATPKAKKNGGSMTPIPKAMIAPDQHTIPVPQN